MHLPSTPVLVVLGVLYVLRVIAVLAGIRDFSSGLADQAEPHQTDDPVQDARSA